MINYDLKLKALKKNSTQLLGLWTKTDTFEQKPSKHSRHTAKHLIDPDRHT